jgi:hypothetical protein
MWNNVESAPSDEDVTLLVSDCCREPYELLKPCRRTQAGWVISGTKTPLAVLPPRWMPRGRNHQVSGILSNPGMPQKPLHDPVSPPAQDPPAKPLHDPPGDPTYEPPRPTTDPTPHPARDPPSEKPDATISRKGGSLAILRFSNVDHGSPLEETPRGDTSRGSVD